MEDPGKWVVDKRVPIVSIIAGAAIVIGQTWYISGVLSGYNYRIAALEDYAKATQPQAAQMAVMQEKIQSVQSSINRIESWLARPNDRQHNDTSR